MSDEAEGTIKTHNPGAVKMHMRRCYRCGRFWAYETFREGEPQCPVCSGKSLKSVQAELDKAHRAIASLRGRLKHPRLPAGLKTVARWRADRGVALVEPKPRRRR